MARLPFDDAAFDLVVAFNSLMDVDDMPGAISEAARVLTDGGCFCICITHPLRDAGRFEAPGHDAPLVISGTYFGKRRYEDTVARDGLQMHFRSWAYALQDYAEALEDARFVIEALREPRDPNRTVPNFLLIRALKRA